MELYRFRPINRLLDDRELENHYFFFSEPSQLNDPQEGIVDLYWRGDIIAWLGLFKFYTFQLFWELLRLVIHDPRGTDSAIDFSWHQHCGRSVPLDNIRQHLSQRVCNEKILLDVAKRLCGKKISAMALKCIFTGMHNFFIRFAVDEISVMGRNDRALIKELESITKNQNGNVKTTIMTLLDDLENVDKIDSIFCELSKNATQLTEFDHKNVFGSFSCYNFSNIYVENIQKLIYPLDCCVCFNADFSNPAMWSYYADEHKGACLVFNNENNYSIELYNTTGESQSCNITAVNYGVPPPQRNFFSSLGMFSSPELEEWLGNSVIRQELYRNIDAWRKQYWADNQARLLRKGNVWRHEKEYRMVLNAESEHPSRGDARKYTYDFKLLSGIIFGVKTKPEDKHRIIKVSKAQCEKNGIKKFNLYQAVYDKDYNFIEKQLYETLP